MSDVGFAWLELAGAALSLAGAFFFVTSAVGLRRLPGFYTRMHAPTKAATLGLAFMGAGAAVANAGADAPVWLEAVLLVAFAFLTVPVSAQMLMRAAVARGLEQAPQTQGVRPVAPVDRVADAGEFVESAGARADDGAR